MQNDTMPLYLFRSQIIIYVLLILSFGEIHGPLWTSKSRQLINNLSLIVEAEFEASLHNSLSRVSDCAYLNNASCSLPHRLQPLPFICCSWCRFGTFIRYMRLHGVVTGVKVVHGCNRGEWNVIAFQFHRKSNWSCSFFIFDVKVGNQLGKTWWNDE